ncbi:MAG TPA: hypothetical protein PLN94_09795, partial [Thiolinea sp.]|nr:hypothetical protein [Thiolinea sp.]
MRLNDDWFRCGLLLCCSLAVMSASGRAAELEPEAAAVWQLWQDDWQCGQPQVPEPELVRELADLGGLQGVRVGELTLPVLIGSHPERLGTVLFVQHEGCWQLYPVADGHWVEGIFATPSGTRFMLFTLWSVEGPGHEYRILRAQDGFGVVDCATLTFPESLNQPEWA